MLTRFSSKGVLPAELLELRAALKGAPGELELGPRRVSVLRLNEKTYVTTETVPPEIQEAVRLDNQDLHVLKTRQDVAAFAERWQGA